MTEMEDGPKISVLIVDDQISMRKGLRRILDQSSTFAVQEFSTLKASIEYLKNNAVDLIISDVYLPVGSGLDLLRYVRSRNFAADVPIIFVSGEATKDEIVQTIELGANDYLIKPFDSQEFLNKVKAVLATFKNPTERLKKLRAGESALLIGQMDLALKIFRDVYEEDSTSPRILVGLGQAEAEFKNFDLAMGYIERAIAENALYFPAYAVGADILLKQHKRTEAIDYILKELAINGKQADRRILLADLFMEMNDHAAAITQMRQSIVDVPNDEAALLKMADIYFLSGEAEKSIHYFLKTRRKVPNSSRALEGISVVCLSQNNPRKALNIFTDFLRLNPMQKDVFLAKSRLYERTGEFENALKEVETFLSTEGESIDARFLKGRILLKLKMHTEAKVTWNEISVLSPLAENFAKIGHLNLTFGQHRDAAIFYEKALFLDKKNIKYLYKMGQVLENLREYSGAKIYYSRVLAINPTHADAVEAQTRIIRGSKAPQSVVPSRAPAKAS